MNEIFIFIKDNSRTTQHTYSSEFTTRQSTCEMLLLMRCVAMQLILCWPCSLILPLRSILSWKKKKKLRGAEGLVNMKATALAQFYMCEKKKKEFMKNNI